MQNNDETIFENVFTDGMLGGDIESFKRDYHTLYAVILISMNRARADELQRVMDMAEKERNQTIIDFITKTQSLN